jgi:uncharacterized protein (TIRG00374 family)
MKLNTPTTRILAKVLVSAGLLVFILRKISVSDLVGLARSADPGWMIAAVAILLLSNVVGGCQWHLLLTASGVRIPAHRTIRFYFVGLFFNNFLPASIGGDAIKVYDVSRIGSSVFQIVAVTMLDRIIGIFSLCLLAAISVLALTKSHLTVTLWPYLLILVGCMIPALAFYFFKPLSRVLRWLVRLLLPPSWGKGGSSILDYLGKFRSRKSLILGLMLLSVAIQAMRVATHVFVAVSLGVRIDPVVVGLFFVFVPILSLAMIPPITINGLGIREGLGIVLLAHAGIGQTDAFAIEFLTYVVSVAVSLMGLAFFVGRHARKVAPTPDVTAS